ncbi:AraC family transcriptional regulator [Winogradskyella echinorum]|uniref:AraC family transcriptional regulator n=1 Tax=Winogradskyella echinorum TaxID=538189 RepID=A0ABR6Y4K0_9FLAO|nr:helix-turn-helix domain-containing protein [Winogradskyella echinorum]MBC3847160.1 AraC family transcriptional regulator [Winogradskyella echinorum]MBC5751508.1 AraC family transcriptional regulator [Winogradskyella echinorum]
MTLKYYDTTNLNPIVEELFQLTFSKEDIPFQSTVLPICFTTITNIYSKGQSSVYKKTETPLIGLIATGQFYESYQFLVNQESNSYGITFHPTALHKITNLDIHKLTNKHVPLKAFAPKLYELLNPIFLTHKDDAKGLTKSLKKFFLELPITTNKTTALIDKLIAIIHKKEGMLNTYELLDYIDFSQKTLETQFKKIVGLTPGKYIRLHRFLKLMRKHEGKEIDLKDLIHMYNYYDHSHFVKDFKHFMKQSPKDYFKSENAFLNEYLNK